MSQMQPAPAASTSTLSPTRNSSATDDASQGFNASSIPAAAPPPSPVRRSLRLSLAPRPLFPSTPVRAVSEEEEDEVVAGLETEDRNDGPNGEQSAGEGSLAEQRVVQMEDAEPEPSSALAERISRAHDNPSPPPKFQLLPEPGSSPEAEPASSKLIDISFEQASPAPQRAHGAALLVPGSPVSPYKSIVPAASSSSKPSISVDLISFDEEDAVNEQPIERQTEQEDIIMASPVGAAAPLTPPPPPTASGQHLNVATPTPRRRSPRLSKAPATLSEPPRPNSPTPVPAIPSTTPPPPSQEPESMLSRRRSISPRRQQTLEQNERLASLSPTTTGFLSGFLGSAAPNPFNPPAPHRTASSSTLERSPSPPRRIVQLQRPPSASPTKGNAPASPARRVPVFKPPAASSSGSSFTFAPNTPTPRSPARRVLVAPAPSSTALPKADPFAKPPGSPQRVPRIRAGSAEPSISPRKIPTLPFRTMQRSVSDSELGFGEGKGERPKLKELPFPLRAAPIAEEAEVEASSDAAPSEDAHAPSDDTAAQTDDAATPMKAPKQSARSAAKLAPAPAAAAKAKSNLRQPSALAGSRIPRKPYARPGAPPASTASSRAKAKDAGAGPSARAHEPAAGPFARIAGAPAAARPGVRTAKAPLPSAPKQKAKEREPIEVDSDEPVPAAPKPPPRGRLVRPVAPVAPAKGKEPEKPAATRRAPQARIVKRAPRTDDGSSGSSSDAAPAPAPGQVSPLKRKRSDDGLGGAPPGAQAYVRPGPRPGPVRKVVKPPPPASALPTPSQSQEAAPPSPQKLRGGMARKVERVPPPAPPPSSAPAPPSALPRLVKSPEPEVVTVESLLGLPAQAQDQEAMVADEHVEPVTVDSEPPGPPQEPVAEEPEPDVLQESEPPSSPAPAPAPAPAPPPSSLPVPAPAASGGRRTRSGRTTNDVFGPIVARAGDSGPFASMTATALRALTAVNTTRNQDYLSAVLETQIVRREGPRPESPQTKVRSMEEKRREEAQRGRGERARRRARRQSGDASSEEESAEASGDGWDGARHRLGAGDDGEFVTPEKARPLKRLRFDGGGGGAAEGEAQEKADRRVRWDKGLYTTFYFDDAPPALVLAARAASAAPFTKGGLAGSARALRLDALGNATSESPVKGLAKEDVVVKKFVYDDDEGAGAVPVPAPAEKEAEVEEEGKGKGRRRAASRS